MLGYAGLYLFFHWGRSHLVSRMMILLKHGVDANIANNKKELPLHKACTSDRNIEVRGCSCVEAPLT